MLKNFTTILILIIASAGVALSAEESVTLCLYSPKLNIDNFKEFKTDFDKYLVNEENLTFQPFASGKDFEAHLQENENYLAIMSGWHYKAFSSKKDMQVLLLGVNDGSTVEELYLVFNKNTSSGKTKTIHVATSLDLGFAAGILNQHTEFSEKAKVLRVPKDIDALMSLTFNVFNVDAALVSAEVYNSYKERYPAYVKELKTTSSGLKTAVMVLAANKNAPKSVTDKAAVIESMNNEKKGRELLSLLQLDSWQKPKESKMGKTGAKDEK